MDEISFDDILGAAFGESTNFEAQDDVNKELFRCHLHHERTEDRLAVTLMDVLSQPISRAKNA